jgi:hypothetical protein
MVELNMTSFKEYNSLLHLQKYNNEQLLKLAQYPYESLVSLCENVSFYERNKIKEIEDLNIWHFINALNLLFGLASKEEQELFNANLMKEPLRTAVYLSQQEASPQNRFITFIELACKILLSNGGKKGMFLDPIDIKIDGNMPRDLFKSRQNIGNEWFNKFVENKLSVLKMAYNKSSPETAYAIVLKSIAYSLYNFTPYRYHIRYCKDEDEALHLILKVFINNIQRIKK